ncbi:hypothetical protein HYY75_07440 [bacterium]|nr:hypothetical protein [bacterium]
MKCESLLPLLVSISSITLFILLIYWVSSYYFNNLISEAAFFACLIIGGFLSSFVGGIGGKFFEYRLVFNFEGGSVSYKNNVFENELFSDLGFSLVPVFQAPELISNITQVSVFLKDFDYICLFYFSSGKVYKGLIVRGEEWFFPFFYRLIELSNCIVDFGNPLLQKRFDDYHDSQDASKAAPTPPN